MKYNILYILLFLSLGLSQEFFPKIIFTDPFTASSQDQFGDYHPRNYNYYAQDLSEAGFNIIHAKNTNSYFDPDYLETLLSYDLQVTSAILGGSNKNYIKKGYQEIWPVGFNINENDFERHLNDAYYLLDGDLFSRAEFYFDNGGTNYDYNDDIYYIRSLVGTHVAGQVLDGAGFWAGYWRYSNIDINLFIEGFIDNIGTAEPTDTVVTFNLYEMDNSTNNELLNEHQSVHPGSYEETATTLPTLNNYSISFLVSDFLTPGELEYLKHPFNMDFNSHTSQTNRIKTHVDMVWHGNVDFYLDGFELRSHNNQNLFTSSDSLSYYNTISNSFSLAYNLNGGQLGMLHSFHLDEPRLNEYHSLGKLNELAKETTETEILGAIAAWGVRGIRKYKYLDFVDPSTVIFNFYPIYGEEIEGQSTSHNSDYEGSYHRTLQEAWDDQTGRIAQVSFDTYNYGIPFIFTPQVQSTSDIDSLGNIHITFREPLISEISAQVWLALSYNVKGIMYFLYSTGHFDKRHHGLVTIDANNNGQIDPGEDNIYDPSLGPYIPNEKYYEVQKLNNQLGLLAPHLLNLNWLNTYSTSDNGPNYDNNPMSDEILVQSIQSEEYPENPYIQIGHFQHQTTGEKYFILVNKRCCLENDGECFEYEDQTLTVTLNINSNYLLEDVLASLEPWDGDQNRVAYRYFGTGENTFTVRLKPGEGKLFRLTNGLSGSIDNDMYLSGEIIISNDLEINPDNIITIYENTSISLGNNISVQVDGELISNGIEENPVIISGNGSISFNNTEVTMSHTNIENVGFVWAKSTTGNLSNCQINTNLGMVIEGGHFEINNCTFESNQVGLLLASRPGESRLVSSIRNSQFNNSPFGLATSYGAIVNLYNNQFNNNDEFGIYSDAFSEPWLFQEDADLGCAGNNNEIIGNNVGIGVFQDAQPWLGIYWDLSNFYEGHNRIDNTHDIENDSFHERPIYAQVNNWNSNTNCLVSSPNSLLGGDVIWEPTVNDIYYDGPPIWDDIIILRVEASGDYTGAAQAYRSIIESDPTNRDALWALTGLARCMGKAGQLQELIVLLASYVADYPGTDLEKYARNYGITKQIVIGDYVNAETMIASFMADYPNSEFEPKIEYESALLAELMGQTAGRTIQDEEKITVKYERLATNFPNTGLGMLATIKIGKTAPTKIDVTLPKQYSLITNYPNPFNPITTISFSLPENSYVMLTIYDLSGREIIKLVDSFKPSGTYQSTWNGKDKNGRSVSSGVYLYSLMAKSKETGEMFTKSNKMVLLK